MKTEQLRQWGLSDQQIALIMRENGLEINGVKEKYAGYDALKEQVSRLKAQEVSAEEVENLRLQAEQWRQKAEETEKMWSEKWKARDYEEALTQSLEKAAARSPRAVRALLDEGAIAQGEDGRLEGLEEQLKQLKNSCPYLFSDVPAPPCMVRPGGGFPSQADDGQIREIMGLPAF